MAKSKKYFISSEVYKYPYCAILDNTEEYLSDKIYRGTVKVRKKVVKKTKRVFVYGQLIFSLSHGLAPIQAISFLPHNLPPSSIMLSIHSNGNLSKKVIIDQIRKQMPAEIDFSEKEINELYHLSIECKTNSLSQEELIAKISNLRGGDFIDVAVGLAIIATIVILTNGFHITPPASAPPPPHLQWLYGNNGQPGWRLDRPSGSKIMAAGNPQSSREELTQLSTDVVPSKTQVSGFLKNGKVDLNQAFNEVNRRASAIGCETFDCSFDRFKGLATECGEINETSVREAITILQGEMQGYYKNARRVNYGPNVKSLDFAVDGLGEFENITHADAKNAVGSAIEIADGFDGNIWRQGKGIGKKGVWQKKFWSNTSRTSEVENLNSDAYLPKSVNNTLIVVDSYDVPTFEKQTMSSAINFGAKNDTNFIILNNPANI